MASMQQEIAAFWRAGMGDSQTNAEARCDWVESSSRFSPLFEHDLHANAPRFVAGESRFARFRIML
ncbi:hypothetical protein [Bradyrhizobium sp. Pha-3]|uniref:hypothetical protein n=1 Tax=Bradyrhizobium TaxID=374 RepID=UPI0035D426C3